MPVNARVLSLLFCVPLLALLTGCPKEPTLSVSPSALSYSSSNESHPITIANLGAGDLKWQITNAPVWLTFVPSQGTVSGSSQVVQAEADLTGLPSGTYTSEIQITSNGGIRTISVTAVVVAPPTLSISPTSLDFGASESTRTFTITNTGAGTLEWKISTPPAGFEVSSTSGSLTTNESKVLTVTCNRSAASPGPLTGTLTVTSNGGTRTVALSAMVQALNVTPLNLDFGSQLVELPVKFKNTGTSALQWTIDSSTLPAWLTLNPAIFSGTLAGGQETSVSFRINRDAMNTRTVKTAITVASNQGSETINIVAEGATPVLGVLPTSLDFGTSLTTKTITIQNTGTGTLKWSLDEGQLNNGVWTSGDLPWASANATSGQVLPGESTTVTVTVDRNTVTPNSQTPYTGYVRIRSQIDEVAYVDLKQYTLPPTLHALPQNIAFSTTYVLKNIAVWNGGLGTINWRIDTQTKPTWLSFKDAVGNVVTGSVTGEQTDNVVVTVNRQGIKPADLDYTYSFNITGTDEKGQTVSPITITVTMNVARVPAISIDTGQNAQGVPNVDATGIAFLPFGTTLTDNSMVISNQGTGTLSWSINTTSLPTWLKSVSPAQSALAPGESVTVNVKIDRTNLSSGSNNYELKVASNDPNNATVPVRVEMQVPKRVIVGIRPTTLDFGLYGISDSFEVANIGDAGTDMAFKVESTKPWLYVYPPSGSSTGLATIEKDWQTINVSIDRGQLDGSGGGAQLKIWAYYTDENNVEQPVPGVEPQYLNISVEAAPLSFEAALARTRIPSLVRLVMLMRDVGYRPIPLEQTILGNYADKFTIYEKDVAVDTIESGQFLSSTEHARTNVAILLDYSGTMDDAAKRSDDNTISGAADPLQALYQRCVGQLIDELPDNYRIALLEFHDRKQPTRLVTAPDNGAAFVRDKTIIHHRLENLSVKDHGATELLPAVEDAAEELVKHDLLPIRIPFDDTDIRLLICVSDGRLTTPPGRIKDTLDLLAGMRVRFLPIGWGEPILHEPLARIAAGTGGHYYPTAPELIGKDPTTKKPIYRPVVSALQNWCQTEDANVAPCDQSVPKDLKSQVMFSYVTLTEDAPIKLRIDATFDNPNDGDGCLEDQGKITGSFSQKDLDYYVIAGDVRMGQISLNSSGVSNGTAQVVIRAEYIPRNVEEFRFKITSAEDFTVTTASAVTGGIVSDWTLTETNPGEYTLTRGTGQTLAYGAFGDLLNVNFTGVAAPVTMQFQVLSPVYNKNDQFQKYFVCPDAIAMGTTEITKPAFPTPSVTVIGHEVTEEDDLENVIDLGDTETTLSLMFQNDGGSHVPTETWLHWELGAITGGSNVTALPEEGKLISTTDINNVTLTFDRSGSSGETTTKVPITFDGGKLGITYTVTLNVKMTVKPAELVVTSPQFEAGTTTLNMGTTLNNASLVISNGGQSTLSWTIDSTLLPTWLAVTPTTGKATMGVSNTASVAVNRTGLASGVYEANFYINSAVGKVLVTVNMNVP